METAQIAAPLSGSKLYQERAREVLPILVRQAKASKPIYYSDLAIEIGIPNPRNLNYVLGSIGTTLKDLSNLWKEAIPPIQCVVINKKDNLPGEGIGWFLDKSDFKKLDRKRKRALIDLELQHIYSYQRWGDVLSTLNLAPSKTDFSCELEDAKRLLGGGESDSHKRLKTFLSMNPQLFGLKAGHVGRVEFPLASGDCLDVCFLDGDNWIAVEAKSMVSNDADITRGLFQCVKYKAVMEAMQIATDRPQNARAILAIDGKLSMKQIMLKNQLGIEVLEQIRLGKDA